MQIRNISTTISLLLTMLILGAQPGFCADAPKIGIVNFQKIFENSEPGKAAKNQLSTAGQTMEADLKQKSDEINAVQQLLERDAGVMSKEAREEKKWELDRKVDDAKALKKRYDRQIQELQGNLINDIRKALLELIRDYGQKEGYAMILEDVGVVYAPPSADLTEKIIKLYNEQHGKQSKKP